MEERPYSSAVRELPLEERPRERLKRLGPEALQDSELLAVLFRTGTRDFGAVALAQQVMAAFGDLRALARASLSELQQVKGLGVVKAIEIKAALELGKRLSIHTDLNRRRIKCAQDVAEILMIRFKDCESEEFKCMLLNAKNEVLRIVDVSKGGLDATMALPRDVYRQAVRESAHAVIVCHNHPSGDPEPSKDDINLTKRLEEGAQVLGMRLLDHVIFGDGRYVSLKERNMF